MVAPGEPVPGVSGTGAVACGASRLRICANASIGAKSATSKAAAAMAQRRKLPRPHPDMPAFFDINRGNFKPDRQPHAPAHNPTKPAPDLARGERRSSEKIMLEQNAGASLDPSEPGAG